MQDIISRLNIKYNSFLENEGRWLGGDFSLIFEKSNNKELNDIAQIKMSVFHMLPNSIKHELLKELDLKGIKYINI